MLSLNRIGLALVVGAVAWLVCLALGMVFAALGIPILAQIGTFLTSYAVIIGALVGLLQYFRGGFAA